MAIPLTDPANMANHRYGNPPDQPFHAYQEHHDSPYSQTSYTNYTAVPNQTYTDDQGSLHPYSYADQHEPSAVPPADTISTASAEKPGATKPALQPHISQPSLTPSNSATLGKPHLISQRNDFLLDWALKILGVASAILFGIWAPISYKITADGNAGNDAAQASLMSQISLMKDEAVTAASAQQSAMSAQQSVVSALAKVQDQLENVGLIWAWEFCSGRTDDVCKDLTSSASITQALSSLGGLIDSSQSTTAATSAPAPTISGGDIPSDSNSSSGGSVSPRDILAIILGSVFGAIVIIGILLGVLAKKRRQRKLIEESQT